MIAAGRVIAAFRKRVLIISRGQHRKRAIAQEGLIGTSIRLGALDALAERISQPPNGPLDPLRGVREAK